MKKRILELNNRYGEKVASLMQELSAIPPEKLNQPPVNGGWSAIQTAWHLMLVEESAMLYVQKKLGYGGVFNKAGIQTRWRIFLLKAALYLPFKFEAPNTVSGENLPLQSTVDALQGRWEKARTAWTVFLAQMPDNLTDKAVFKHPRAGKISWLQMLDFFESHFNRHLQQIRSALPNERI
jgi:hypothetical protein